MPGLCSGLVGGSLIVGARIVWWVNGVTFDSRGLCRGLVGVTLIVGARIVWWVSGGNSYSRGPDCVVG